MERREGELERSILCVMKGRSFILLVASFVYLVQPKLSGAPLTLYVAPNGNDLWSGRLDAPSPDRRDGPLASLSAALKTVRSLPAKDLQTADGVSILLRGGVYELDEPIVLLPEDSGASAEKPLVIENYENETPVLSGGRRIEKWEGILRHPKVHETSPMKQI